jgi:hypothetical protein
MLLFIIIAAAAAISFVMILRLDAKVFSIV